MRWIARGEGEVTVRAEGLRPSRAREFYELWLLDGPGRLVSVGTFRAGADGRARARFTLAVDPRDYATLDVSVEPVEGGPEHSAESVLRSGAL